MTREEAIKMIQDDIRIHHDALSGKYRKALRIAIEALEQPEIVQCKDCRKGTVLDECYVECNLYKAIHAPMFHCADGEKRTD